MAKSSKDTIKVKLKKEGNADVLEFCLSPSHTLNLNQDNQDAIKSMFCALTTLLKEEDILLELEIDKSFDSDLMKEVATDYIKDLNAEISNVRTNMLNKCSESSQPSGSN